MGYIRPSNSVVVTPHSPRQRNFPRFLNFLHPCRSRYRLVKSPLADQIHSKSSHISRRRHRLPSMVLPCPVVVTLTCRRRQALVLHCQAHRLCRNHIHRPSPRHLPSNHHPRRLRYLLPTAMRLPALPLRVLQQPLFHQRQCRLLWNNNISRLWKA